MTELNKRWQSPGWADILRMICEPENDLIWRVTLLADGSVRMSYIGYIKARDYETKTYPTLDNTPEWVRDRIAVLRMMPMNPNESVVYGVGRRIHECTFWVVEPEDADGVDA